MLQGKPFRVRGAVFYSMAWEVVAMKRISIAGGGQIPPNPMPDPRPPNPMPPPPHRPK